MSRVYSLDDENFNFSSLDEVFDDLKSEGLLRVGQVYYSADSETFNPLKYIKVDNILENLDERMYDDLGECYNYDMSCASVAAKEELEALMKDWVEKHIKMNYWTTKGESVECTVEEGDLE